MTERGLIWTGPKTRWNVAVLVTQTFIGLQTTPLWQKNITPWSCWWTIQKLRPFPLGCRRNRSRNGKEVRSTSWGGTDHKQKEFPVSFLHVYRCTHVPGMWYRCGFRFILEKNIYYISSNVHHDVYTVYHMYCTVQPWTQVTCVTRVFLKILFFSFSTRVHMMYFYSCTRVRCVPTGIGTPMRVLLIYFFSTGRCLFFIF